MFGTHKKRNPAEEQARTLLDKFNPKRLAEIEKEQKRIAYEQLHELKLYL